MRLWWTFPGPAGNVEPSIKRASKYGTGTYLVLIIASSWTHRLIILMRRNVFLATHFFRLRESGVALS